MQRKRILAAVMSLCMVAGAASYGAPVISQTITAQADAVTEAECYSFDEETGALTLRGEVDGDALREFNSINCEKVNSVVAEEGTVLPENSNKLFYYYINCTSIDLSNADTSNVTYMYEMFGKCFSLTTLDLSSFDTSNVTEMGCMFMDCSKLITLDVSKFDTSNVTDMSQMFFNCSSLTTLDLSGFDTSNVINMISMFDSCSILTTLDVSGFDTRNVYSMSNMFRDCYNIISMDLSSFDTRSVTDMYNMFWECRRLYSLDLSSFNTSNVTNMDGMFHGCHNLTLLDISSFDIRNVTDMDYMYMFGGCFSLTTLDLSGFDTSKVTNMDRWFRELRNLSSLTLGENFKNVPEEAMLNNGKGWVNVNAPSTVVSGTKDYAVIENNGKNTYIRFVPTFPTYIKVKYSKDYNIKSHQVRFTWDRVEGADKYGIAVYLAGKWKVQDQEIISTSYTTPKSLTPGKTYKVAIAARVNGKWDTTNAIKNAVTVTIK